MLGLQTQRVTSDRWQPPAWFTSLSKNLFVNWTICIGRHTVSHAWLLHTPYFFRHCSGALLFTLTHLMASELGSEYLHYEMTRILLQDAGSLNKPLNTCFCKKGNNKYHLTFQLVTTHWTLCCSCTALVYGNWQDKHAQLCQRPAGNRHFANIPKRPDLSRSPSVISVRSDASFFILWSFPHTYTCIYCAYIYIYIYRERDI